ncbi:endonuclease/exonuclease/phosphatase family protein [Pontibacter korlensis]|uniref:Endonuclease n=1 Tax=Pontibacter korlensis TaxID=400092 RepID=A0A0E3UYC2_9BACT|nr:endonuclease/exonuclease/phosphatase family protein [Pontibacter korlensis]AKD04336.1 endonuclease [Pontibacter korlensis]
MNTIRLTLFYLVLVTGTLLIIATLLSLIYDVRFWYIKALDFPRLQVLIGLLVCLIVFASFSKHWKLPSVLFLLGLLASIVLQASFILPYTPLADKAVETAAPHTVEEGSSFSLLVANMWMENRQAAAFLKMVHNANPDVVLAMETDKWWTSRLNPLRQRYPYQVLHPLDNTYGMALYSRFPLEGAEVKFLSHEKVPSIHTKVRLPDGSLFVLYAMHPVPPKPSEHPDNVGEEEVALLKVGETVAQRQLPTVVAGDFNDVAWSRTSRLFGTGSGLADVRVGRGLYNSFDATSSLLRWPLDHVYVSGEFRVLELERLPKFGSDHFPILVKLALEE